MPSPLEQNPPPPRRIVPAIGLTPDDKAHIRFRCGHGCARCAVTVYRFCELPPNARLDEKLGDMVLLCPGCMALLEGPNVTDAQIALLNSRPIARQPGLARDRLPYHHLLPRITIGGQDLTDTPVPISLSGIAPLLFAPPDSGLGATTITALFDDSQGNPRPVVEANEWLAPGDWRFDWRGHRLSMSSTRERAMLALSFQSRSHIVIEELVTRVRGRSLIANEEWLEVDGLRYQGSLQSGAFIGLDL